MVLVLGIALIVDGCQPQVFDTALRDAAGCLETLHKAFAQTGFARDGGIQGDLVARYSNHRALPTGVDVAQTGGILDLPADVVGFTAEILHIHFEDPFGSAFTDHTDTVAHLELMSGGTDFHTAGRSHGTQGQHGTGLVFQAAGHPDEIGTVGTHSHDLGLTLQATATPQDNAAVGNQEPGRHFVASLLQQNGTADTLLVGRQRTHIVQSSLDGRGGIAFDRGHNSLHRNFGNSLLTGHVATI